MLDKTRITEVVTANIFEPITEATRQKMADALGIPAHSVLLGNKVISVIDGQEVYRIQLSDAGAVTFLETDLELAEAVLNDAFQRDPVGIWLLLNNRVKTTDEMAQSGTVMPGAISLGSGDTMTMSALDLLNGVLYAMTGHRLVPRWSGSGENGELHFEGFKIGGEGMERKAPIGTLDLGTVTDSP